MPSVLFTVDNLVAEVRSKIDEQNRDSMDTERDILPALNRAWKAAADIYARKYPEPLLVPRELPLVGNKADYILPDDVFEDRLLKVEIRIPSGSNSNQSTYRPVKRVSYRDISIYESSGLTNIPVYYTTFGRTLRFVATPTGTYPARIWIVRRPEKLVLPQGRITKVNQANNYVVVDQVGDKLTTEADALGSYVNVINGATGEIRATLQIQILQENRITFRSTPARSTVVGRSVVGSLANEIQPDDYLAPIDGTCVPYYGDSGHNFVVEFASAQCIRSLGQSTTEEMEIVKQFENQIGASWVGREQSRRVTKANQVWGPGVRRYPRT